MSERIWTSCSWGDLAVLEYGKALRDYRDGSGDTRVYGTNGPIGWTDGAQGSGPTVVVGRKGAYRGVHYSPGPFWVIDTAYWLRPTAKIDMRWAYYQLLTQDINGRDSGSAIPSLSRSDFATLEVALPPLAEQRAIAEVLGALDDKIEANRRVASRCEELAATLASLHPPKLALSALAHHLHNMVSPSAFGLDHVEHFSLPAFDSGGLPVIEAGSDIKSGKFRLAGSAVLVSKLNPHIPRVWLAQPKGVRRAVTSTEFVVLSPRDACPVELLWAMCRSPQFSTHLLEMVKGTTGSHQRVTPGDVLRIEVQDPQDFSDAERDAIVTAARLSHSLRRESANLAAARNVLLPKLLGGELRVNRVDSDVLTETCV